MAFSFILNYTGGISRYTQNEHLWTIIQKIRRHNLKAIRYLSRQLSLSSHESRRLSKQILNLPC